ncbi:MAG: penicillin-binding transpeptidase domain-containing protein [Bacillota bacterium]|nr:penicillin-binding transpeptidase domain-containing protein [Bacillota bacterium]
MKKIEKRAIMCLLLGLVLVVGVGIFSYRYVVHGGDWASYEGNRDVYAKGDIKMGALYDRDGQLLMKNTSDGMQYHSSSSVRKALMHITGDKDNNISTGANRALSDELIGYDLINGVYSLNKEGKEIKLTLDSKACSAAYNALNGRKGCVGVYNYKTGEVLCMVSSPSYDPANPPKISADDDSGVFINRFTSAKFAPGSVFKLVTAAAAIESLNNATGITAHCIGVENYGHGDKVTDLSAHGTVDMKNALRVSCNVYFGQLAQKVGAGKIKKYVGKTGLDSSYNIDGIETAAGSFEYPSKGVNLAWTGIGQYKDMVNPCAMMVFMGGIANEGEAINPYIVVRDSWSDKLKSYLPNHGVQTTSMLESTTAATLKSMMANNVANNYGSGMFPGLKVCAKSGTAEVGGNNRPNAWFVGFVDDDTHPYAFAVMVENGGYGTSTGGTVANKVLQSLVN